MAITMPNYMIQETACPQDSGKQFVFKIGLFQSNPSAKLCPARRKTKLQVPCRMTIASVLVEGTYLLIHSFPNGYLELSPVLAIVPGGQSV